MSDSTDWSKYVANINTSGSTGWTPKPAPWVEAIDGVKDRTRYLPRVFNPHTRPSTHGLNRPAIPFNPKTGTYDLTGLPGNREGGGDQETKTATTSIFTDAFFLALPDYEIEALLSLKSLTGNEILQVAHRENFYTTSAVLNNNILDIVDSINFYSPTQIIKLQKPDLSYFQNNLGAYRVSLTSSVVTINIPSPGIDQSFKMEVETFAPKSIKNDTIYTL